MSIKNSELKRLILDSGMVKEDILDRYFKMSINKDGSFWDTLVSQGVLSDVQIGQVVSVGIDVPFINLDIVQIENNTLNLISRTVADDHTVVAFSQDDDSVKIATSEPFDTNFLNILQKISGKDILPYYATPRQIVKTIKKYRKTLQKDINDLLESNMYPIEEKEDNSLISTIVSMIITYGFENEASDVHFEPRKDTLLIRYRIDGILHDMVSLPLEIDENIVSRIKVLSRLRTDEHKSAQDGRLKFIMNDTDLDVRVSIIPTSYGEKVVLRLLASDTKLFSLGELGLSGEDLEKVTLSIKNSNGIILSTGPTGSGKTTTLYAILRILNQRGVNITTIEDPIEYRMIGANQIQVDIKTNLTFAYGLRSILRQDPDIIMVGEIRDEETAGIAINASMTGHLVLSTLHTNDAATALPRLLDMNVESYLVASTVDVIIAQRLVRKICQSCIKSYKLDKVQIDKYSDIFGGIVSKLQLKRTRFYTGQGCSVCNHTGYHGRIGIFEVLVVDDDIRDLIKNKADSSTIASIAIKKGMHTMLEDGYKKTLTGITTLDEVIRVSYTT